MSTIVFRDAADNFLREEEVDQDPLEANPPGPTRLDAVEAKLEAVAELAEQADATAQDVAKQVRDTT